MKFIIKQRNDEKILVDYVKKYNLPKNTELNYDKLEFSYSYRAPWDDEEYEIEDYTYFADSNEVFDYLLDFVMDDLPEDLAEEFNNKYNTAEGKEILEEFLANNYEKMVEKYNQELLENFEEEAISSIDIDEFLGYISEEK